MTDLLSPHRDDGARAALRGDPLTACPWKPGTVGGTAWAMGWHAGRLMRPVARPLALLASLLVVVWPGRMGDVEDER